MSDSDQQNVDGNMNNNNDFICGVVEGFYGKPWTFEQRHDLFRTLRQMRLNSFMYAPKDDGKHRAKWRQLYNEAEAQELRSLIEEAKLNGIDFYYSLAPGLDMVYSDQEEIDCLTNKFDQLVELGCQSFAILFDDIEPTITNDKDSQVFKNYASAQVSVTNLIFDYLNKPKFLFCPTEYCASRAVPNVSKSHYLNTIGTGLKEGIDIMWSGPRVISRFITEESIEELSMVLRRPPVIWENLHANDYDKRRVFMGPYSGRSTRIIPKLRGVLTNPNCEYEVNYIAIDTLAQWSRCTQDINQNNRCNPKTPTPLECLNDEDCTSSSHHSITNLDQSIYDPHRALAIAIKNWLPKLLNQKTYGHHHHQQHDPLRNDTTSLDSCCQVKLNQQQEQQTTHINNNNNNDDETAAPTEATRSNDNDHIVDMVSEDMTQSSGASGDSQDSHKSQMDTSSNGNGDGNSPAASITQCVHDEEPNSCDSCEMPDANLAAPQAQDTQILGNAPMKELEAGHSEDSCGPLNLSATANSTEFVVRAMNKSLTVRDSSSSCCCCCACSSSPASSSRLEQKLNLNNLSLLVELFYLPFEHGSYANALLESLKWLRDNSGLITHTLPARGPTSVSKLPADSEQRQAGSDRAATSSEQDAAESGSSYQDKPLLDFSGSKKRSDKSRSEDDSESDNSNDAPSDATKTPDTWRSRADKLNMLCSNITNIIHALVNDCPNRSLVVDLYPYLADLKESMNLIKDFIKFLRCRNSIEDCFYEYQKFGPQPTQQQHQQHQQQQKDSSSSSFISISMWNPDEQEPWVHRGGLMGDIFRLIY